MSIKTWFHKKFFGLTDDEAAQVKGWIPKPAELERRHDVPPFVQCRESMAESFRGLGYAEYPLLNEEVREFELCPECGNMMPEQTGRGRRRIYCSPECTRVASNRKRREAYAEAKNTNEAERG